MLKLGNIIAHKCSAIVTAAFLLTTSAITAEYSQAQTEINTAEPSELTQESNIVNPTPLVIEEDINNSEPMAQVTNVSQLRDVSPGDWAYEALTSLVERYGCIAGYPNGTFRGNRSITRYEFAAGLNACLNQIERLISSSQAVIKEDLDKVQKLVDEFSAELTALSARVDNLEGRTKFLEDHQFSTTTKLQGEVAFTLANAFGDNIDSQTTFTDRVRLQLVTSFNGKDKLYTRLSAGNLDNSFTDEIATAEGRFAYDGEVGNNVVVDRLHYYFPVGDKLTVYAMANTAGHHFYLDTFNPGLESGGGASGALSRFGERNPIYRLGLGGQGLAFTYKLNDTLQVSAGYLTRGGNDPSEGAGLFNGNYSALGQIVFKPTSNLKLGFTYLNGYDTTARPFALGGTGTPLANLRLGSVGVAGNQRISSNTYGVQAQFDLAPQFSIRAWGGFTDAKLIGLGDAEIWNYAVALAFPDLGKEGNMGAIIFGAEPYLASLSVPGSRSFSNDLPLHLEVLYKYKLTNKITITPGAIVLFNPQQNDNRDTVVIGALRTTFSF